MIWFTVRRDNQYVYLKIVFRLTNLGISLFQYLNDHVSDEELYLYMEYHGIFLEMAPNYDLLVRCFKQVFETMNQIQLREIIAFERKSKGIWKWGI